MLNLIFTATATAASTTNTPVPVEITSYSSWEPTLQSSGHSWRAETSYADTWYYADSFDETKITIDLTRMPG